MTGPLVGDNNRPTPEQQEWEATMEKATDLLTRMLDSGLAPMVAVALTVEYYSNDRGFLPSETEDNAAILAGIAGERSNNE